MSCDQLPFETQPEMTKSDKRKQGKRHHSASWLRESDEDSGNEYDLHYEPLPVPMPPSVTTERHTELETDPEHDSQSEQQRVGAAVPVAIPAQPVGGEQREERNEPAETLPDEEINLPVRNLSGDHSPNTSPSSNIAVEPETPTYQLPQRERRPPKRMTYDQLGVPSCYSIQPPPQLLPVYPAPGLFPWLPPLQPYYLQPPCLYGLQQV